jgi:hypothetical protein
LIASPSAAYHAVGCNSGGRNVMGSYVSVHPK